MRKGFYICTRFREEVKIKRIKEFIDILISSNYIGDDIMKKHKQRQILRILDFSEVEEINSIKETTMKSLILAQDAR